MPAYSFKERFIQEIKKLIKDQTIRGKRKRGGPKPGDTLYFYYGMRTKWCTWIGQAICTKVEDILILVTGVFVDGKLLEDAELELLARKDGFKDWDDMLEWWILNNQIPFRGDIIHWKDFTDVRSKKSKRQLSRV